MNNILLLAACLLFCVSCDSSYEAQRTKFEKFVKAGKIGSSSDVYLVKNGAAGPERIALIFGFMDDFSFCREVAELYVKKYPRDSYSCELAN